MNIDQTLVKLDCICARLEDVLAELGRVAKKRPRRSNDDNEDDAP